MWEKACALWVSVHASGWGLCRWGCCGDISQARGVWAQDWAEVEVQLGWTSRAGLVEVVSRRAGMVFICASPSVPSKPPGEGRALGRGVLVVEGDLEGAESCRLCADCFWHSWAAGPSVQGGSGGQWCWLRQANPPLDYVWPFHHGWGRCGPHSVKGPVGPQGTVPHWGPSSGHCRWLAGYSAWQSA